MPGKTNKINLKLLAFLISFIFTSTASFAQQAIRICDKEGDCIDVSASEELQVTQTNTNSGVTAGDPQIRICDKEGHCLDIASDGSLQIE